MIRLAIVGIIAAGIVFTGSAAYGQGDDQGALVLQGQGCSIFVKPAGVPIRGVFTTESHAILTPNGNSVLVCQAQLPATVPGPPQAVVFNGVPCYTLGGW